MSITEICLFLLVGWWMGVVGTLKLGWIDLGVTICLVGVILFDQIKKNKRKKKSLE